MKLVDTSAWVEYLRDTGSTACVEVGRLLSEPVLEVVTTPVIVMELLAGATSDGALISLEQLVAGLPSLALNADLDFHAAAAVYRSARRQGWTVRGLVDCLIGVVAQRHGAILVHRDADLAHVTRCLPTLATLDLR